MTSLHKDCRISSMLLQFTLLMWAVTPVTYRINWLFYTLFGIIVLCSCVLVYFRVRIAQKREDDEEIQPIINDRWDLIHYGMITLVGIIVTYSVGDRLLWAWVIFLLLFIIDFFYKKKKRK